MARSAKNVTFGGEQECAPAERDKGKRTWKEEFGIWWQEDSATDVCNVCDKEFALLRRRHHCRFCGDVVCAACTNSKALHPKSNTLEYICRTCAAELARMIDEIKKTEGGNVLRAAANFEASRDDLADYDEPGVPVFGALDQNDARSVQDTAAAVARIDRVRRGVIAATKTAVFTWYLKAMEAKYDAPPSYDEDQALRDFRDRATQLSKAIGKEARSDFSTEKMEVMRQGWDCLSPEQKAVLDSGDAKKMHKLLEDAQREILMSPRSERKALKAREKVLDNAVAQRLMLASQMQAETEMRTDAQANRVGRLADNADSVSLAKMLAKHKESQANEAIEMLHRLNKLAYGSNMRTLGDVEVMEAVVSAMAAHPKHIEVQIEGCAAIANLSGSVENSRKLADLGACQQVTATLKNHQTEEDIQLWGCRAIANLASTESNRPVLSKAGGVKAAKKAIKHFPDNEDITSPANSVISRC